MTGRAETALNGLLNGSFPRAFDKGGCNDSDTPAMIARVFLKRRKTMTGSPLRWAGSKRSLLPYIRAAMPESFNSYLEPFMGSACVFFDVAPQRATLSDFNLELVDFFRVLRDSPSRLYKSFTSWSISGDDYYDVRSLDPGDLDTEERAARFLYLNRFAFNGVYRTNRQGVFNVPKGARTGRIPSHEELLVASRLLVGKEINHADYLATTSEAGKGDFVYLDPPYRNESRPTYGEYGYGSFGLEEDVQSLAVELDRLDRLGAFVMLSFNDDSGLEQVLDNWFTTRVSRRRNVAGVAKARTELRGEILSTNYGRGSNA